VAINAIAGGPFSGIVASFTDDDPGGVVSDYSAQITWGDGNTSTGIISSNGNGGFNVSGGNTYAGAGSYSIGVHVVDIGGSFANANSSAAVTNLGLFVHRGQTATIGFWANNNGQALINSFNGGSTSTSLA